MRPSRLLQVSAELRPVCDFDECHVYLGVVLEVAGDRGQHYPDEVVVVGQGAGDLDELVKRGLPGSQRSSVIVRGG